MFQQKMAGDLTESQNNADAAEAPRAARPLAEVTKTYVLAVCEMHLWNKAAAAEALGIHVNTLYDWLAKWGGAPHKRKPRRENKYVALMRSTRQRRAEEMAALYRDGMTLAEVGAKYNVTRERVRQLLKTVGVSGSDGGAHIKFVRRDTAHRADRERRCLEKNGMAVYEYNLTRKVQAPIGQDARVVFSRQRNAMRGNQGFEWTLTFAEWWDVWQKSGKWDERGLTGYWLVRKNNQGAYTAGNVEVVRGKDFVSFVRQTEKASGRGIGKARTKQNSDNRVNPCDSTTGIAHAPPERPAFP